MLPYEKSNTGGNQSWPNICSPKKTWHKSQQWTGSLRSLTSSPPPLGEVNTSHPLFSCRWLLHKHKHPGRACVQLDGFPVEQEEAQPVWWWERHHAALPEGQPGALNVELWVDVCLIPRWDDNKLWYPHIASKLICFPGDIFVLIGFVIIGG